LYGVFLFNIKLGCTYEKDRTKKSTIDMHALLLKRNKEKRKERDEKYVLDKKKENEPKGT